MQEQTHILPKTLMKGLKRVSYSALQMPRIAWYTGHYALGRRKMGPLTNPGEAPYAEHSAPLDRDRLKASFRELFKKDWANIGAGIYKMPLEATAFSNPMKLWKQSRDYFIDAEKVAHRKVNQHHSEVLSDHTREKFPRYFLQNFHFQTDGWLTKESAERYDMQVETIFTGSAAAMRRTTLPFIAQKLQENSPDDLKLLDFGCGTGCYLNEVKHNWPNLNVTGLDLSPAYVGKARARLGKYSNVDFVNAPAENTGLSPGSYDIITAVYLFHELPPKVRAAVLKEAYRVLRPGGLFIIADSIQYGDEPGLDILLENFPRGFHEPYYDSHCREDYVGLSQECGFAKRGSDIGFLTKTLAFEKLLSA